MKLKFIDEFKIGCLIKLSAFDKIGQNTIKIKGVSYYVDQATPLKKYGIENRRTLKDLQNHWEQLDS